ncbi:MAG: AAA family ATPase [Gaeavirus sp.]|uniref:AAA family ATPase n=1 Tax=Gaeavirus sp. TaxID=2487767 RepID=A0A3G4ZZB6_9VIRU|nr:MAG: AAA family ATPase [Gaeavirus sp.]
MATNNKFIYSYGKNDLDSNITETRRRPGSKRVYNSNLQSDKYRRTGNYNNNTNTNNNNSNWRDFYDDDDYNNYFNTTPPASPTVMLPMILPPLIIPCENDACDHILHKGSWYDANPMILTEINTIDDLLKLGLYYHCQMRIEYNGIDMKILYNLKPSLQELNNMIGISKIKEEIVNTIIYFLISKSDHTNANTNHEKSGLFDQNYKNQIENSGLSDMMHAVITGPPGCGKTTFIEILAKIYVNLGILSKGHIVKVRRTDLIGKYLGHTAKATQNKIDEAIGGILLIDEAYSLGNPEGRDSFAKECIDTLNQALSEQKTQFVCIIAGYANALDTSFFKYNEGLKRRFPFRYDIEKYSSDELSQILYKKIESYNPTWKIQFIQKELFDLIKDNFKYFLNQGGDMESIFLGSKISHNKRVFLLPLTQKLSWKIIDIKTAINKFITLHNLKNTDSHSYSAMYI